ncbi:hypothetical protein BJ741DRAFT_620066 [Chytriomyces cf. hyalinus JEL632]|nr:hypothetical protein BJ741DRAFT_620066 [Chytriomyces cf. hyalinus JEL632]
MDLSSHHLLLSSSGEVRPGDLTGSPIIPWLTPQALHSTPGAPPSLQTSPPGMQDIFESPSKSGVVDSMVYTRPVIKAPPVLSTLRLHELIRFKDDKLILTDHEMDFDVSSDRKQLVYTLTPKTVAATDFIDPRHSDISHPPTTAIVQYFHNDSCTEEFTYTITLPKAVDSNCSSKRSVYRAIHTTDLAGHPVTIMQAVAKVLVYMVSGQHSGNRESNW